MDIWIISFILFGGACVHSLNWTIVKEEYTQGLRFWGSLLIALVEIVLIVLAHSA
jgi:hypothetical protein